MIISLIHAVARRNVHRSFPALLTDGLLADERNALVGNEAICLFADEGAVDALHGQRLVVITIGNRLVLAVLCPDFLS